MIEREIAPHLLRLIGQYPILTITGPRQSGKTTLCRRAFGNLPYANLEDPDVRDFAIADPRAFLAQFPSGAVLDKIEASCDALLENPSAALAGRAVARCSANMSSNIAPNR